MNKTPIWCWNCDDVMGQVTLTRVDAQTINRSCIPVCSHRPDLLPQAFSYNTVGGHPSLHHTANRDHGGRPFRARPYPRPATQARVYVGNIHALEHSTIRRTGAEAEAAARDWINKQTWEGSNADL